MGLKETVQSYNVTNIIGYLRKSRQDIEREKRTGEDTLSEQRELMTRTLNSIELPYEMKMEVVSGESIDGRPVFKEVIGDLESGNYQAVAVKELSRLSRGNMGDAQRIIDLLRDNRLIIITPYKVYDVRNQMDMKQIRFELFLAREEYEMIKERMVNARLLYASQGKWVSGAAPFGYVYNKKTRKLEIKSDEADVVYMIYDWFLNGIDRKEVSYQAIATKLTKLKIPTPRGRKTWSYVQVKTILTNVLYKGTVQFRTTERNKKGKRVPRPESEHIIVENAHDPIIETEIWNQVQLKIKNKAPLPHNPLAFEPNELAGICTCSECGSKLIRNAGTRLYSKKDGTSSSYYQEFLKCISNACMSIKYRDVEEAILFYLEHLEKLDNEHLEEVAKSIIYKEKNLTTNDTKEHLLKQIQHKEKELNDRMEFIFQKFEQGIYSDEVFLQRKSAIDKEREELKIAAKELETESVEEQIPVEPMRKNISTFLDAYQNAETKEAKNEILRLLFHEVKVKVIKKGHGRIPAEFNIAPILRYSVIETPYK